MIYKLDPNPRAPGKYDEAQINRKLQAIHEQVNRLAEGTLVANYNADTALPVSGTYAVGDFVKNKTPVEAGVAGSKYVILGWVCSVAGTPGTWLQVTALTGSPAAPGTGTVTSVSVVTANGLSGTVATPTTTPAITLTAGALTPSSVAASGTVTGSNLSGTNTGDQTITLTGPITGSGTGTFATSIASQTGTGTKFVVDTSPVLVTPTLGVASATSINFGQTTLNYYKEGTWTVTDGSGASLVLTSTGGQYVKVGSFVHASVAVTYPATADVSNAALGGLPFTTRANGANSGNICYTNQTTSTHVLSANSATTATWYTAGGANVTNAQMSGSLSYIEFNYEAI